MKTASADLGEAFGRPPQGFAEPLKRYKLLEGVCRLKMADGWL